MKKQDKREKILVAGLTLIIIGLLDLSLNGLPNVSAISMGVIGSWMMIIWG